MRYSILIAFIILSVAMCANEDESATLYKYREACPGTIGDEETTFGQFVTKALSEEENSLRSVCQADFFSTIPESCDDSHKACVKAVQEFMWDRCHWRFLYYVEEKAESLQTYVNEKFGTDTVLEMFVAMNEDDHIYDFATKCGSWDWAGIGIMIACSFFGSYILLWIIGGIMRLFKKSPTKQE